ncbi:DUF4174 domain-containing protein [Pseudoruegeria sp. SHC-113]|uniref:DUF4174 domain-containing protein n=1 Tax=Pseudoruegeria sp. SHC-113 TaxID=2855439 RepID=UPI0021BB31B8|nr:DUF4174 domain-containing protein [Pseudoruegeria sp. SHC-113]MCT8159740.1 DUF4174 domain-containing protein [Pseudoruegeria sp. SHC-113]
MKQCFALALAGFILVSHAPAGAQDATETVTPEVPAFAVYDAKDVTLDEFLWVARPIVVFADTEADPRVEQQLEYLRAEWPMLAERDVVVITDTDPAAKSDIRTKLRPRGFMMTLIAKDGRVALRKPQPWTVREITRTIDKMPDRVQEIRDRRGS